MRTTLATLLSALAVMTGLNASPAWADCSRTSTGGIIGGVVGAGAGIGIGSLIGSGTGKKIAMGLGGLGGLILGNEIGRRLDCNQQQRAVQNHNTAMETQPVGTTSQWKDPDSATRGTTTPTSKARINESGEPCRDYVTTVVHDGESHQIKGTACRKVDGKGNVTWVPQNES